MTHRTVPSNPPYVHPVWLNCIIHINTNTGLALHEQSFGDTLSIITHIPSLAHPHHSLTMFRSVHQHRSHMLLFRFKQVVPTTKPVSCKLTTRTCILVPCQPPTTRFPHSPNRTTTPYTCVTLRAITPRRHLFHSVQLHPLSLIFLPLCN
jgi:hypothetical protein